MIYEIRWIVFHSVGDVAVGFGVASVDLDYRAYRPELGNTLDPTCRRYFVVQVQGIKSVVPRLTIL